MKDAAPETPPLAIPPIPPMGAFSSPSSSSPPPLERKEESPPKKKYPRLDHWAVLLAEAESYEPGDFKFRLRGEIHGHPNPRFTEGEVILSSPLISLDVTQRIAKTKNTVYDLGEPDPTFVEYVLGINKKLEDYNFSFEGDLRKKKRSL
jgi:hypothetical protein